MTQGRGDQADQTNHHLKLYHLEYTLDGVVWNLYQGGRTFRANSDWSTQVAHELEDPFEAVSIKLVVHEWFGTHICLRFGAFFEVDC